MEIRVGIIGVGQMGMGLVYQCGITPGIRCVAITDIDPKKCEEAVTLTKGALPFEQKPPQVLPSGEDVADACFVDVVIDATNTILAAASFDSMALKREKHLVMMNAEADLIFGPALMKMAKENGCTYTSCDGDQPGVIKRLVDEIQAWGFKLVMAGNMKGFLDRYSNPSKIIPEADKRNIDYKMASAMADGTKLNIEMALVANALNLGVRKPGMFGPELQSVRDVFSWFVVPGRRPYVDYILGAQPDGGVFVIGYCDNSYQKNLLKYYKMGDGPYYLFYRPYHLCHVEAMQCVKDAYAGKALLQPTYGFKTNVYAYAKRDLIEGHVLDGIGCFDCYGLIETHDADRLPICLAEEVTLKRGRMKDEALFMSDIEDKDLLRADFELYRKGLE